MKQISIILALIAIPCLSATAQDYRAFSTTEQRLFEYNQSGSEITAVTVQQVAFDGDSIYYFAPNWHYLVDEMGFQDHNPKGPSLLGEKLLIADDGTHIFYNHLLEPIEIRPQEVLASTWTAYTFPDGTGFIQAKVIQEGTEIILGISENVKTIGLKRFNSDMQPMASQLNDLYFKFGETLGLINAPELRYFPGFLYYEFPQMLDLKGIDNGIGIQNLTMFDIMDFQPGDEIEVATYEYDSGTDLTYQAERFLERTDYPDSIVYQIEIKTWSYIGPEEPENAPLEFIDSVVTQRVVYPNSSFDAPPGTPDIESMYGPDGEIWIKEGNLGLEKRSLMEPQVYDNQGDTSFTLIWDTEVCILGTQSAYIKGLGGPYYTCYTEWVYGLRWRQLRYFQKGDQTWGTSYIPLSVNKRNELADLITVFPVPASERLAVTLPGKLKAEDLRLTDMQGRTVKQSPASLPLVIEVSDLENGIYILQITLTSGQVIGKKVVVRK